METKEKNPGYLIAMLSAVILSTTGIFIAYLSREFALPPLVLSFWREFLVFLILLIYLAFKNPAALRAAGRNYTFLIPYGIVLAVFNALWTFSVALNGAALGTFLVYTSPIFTAILSRLFLKDKMSVLHMFCILLSISGCLFISGFLSESNSLVSPLGLGTGLLSGLAFGVYTMLGRQAGEGADTDSVWSFLCWIFGIASLVMLLMNAISLNLPFKENLLAGNLFHLGSSFKGWTVLLLLAGLPTLSGYGSYNLSLKYLPPLTVSLIASSEPAFTAVLAYFLLNERMGPSAAAGCCLILISVILIQTGIPGFRRADSLT
jgi:drug/metabolite transporter (DMT)-like permease